MSVWVISCVKLYFDVLAMLVSTLVIMIDVVYLSVNEWPSPLEHLNITKAVKDIESSDLLGKGLDFLEK